MRTENEIRLDIERATERRTELYHLLSQGHDVELQAELRALDERIASLWDEQREARVRRRFGEREVIVKRARLEERLERAA